MYYVVTGAAGFIGSNLVARAERARRSRDIIAVDNLRERRQVRRISPAARSPTTSTSASSWRSSKPAGCDGGIDAVLHQGACSDTMETDGRYMMENNYRYSMALLDWCQDEEVPLIYASSAAVYGAGQGVPRDARERGAAQRLRLFQVPVRPVGAAAARRGAARRSRASAISTSTGRTRRTRGAWPRSPSISSTSSAPRAG